MKKLRITVNNMVYDVTVQVLEDDEQVMSGTAYPGSLPVAPTPARPTQAPTPAPASPAPGPSRPATGDANAIASPIAGTVQKVYVEVGKRVEAKAPAFLLDAMKMDTYIYAPRGGNVAEVLVAAGEAVQVGQILMRYRPED